jgi:hypothetical protein
MGLLLWYYALTMLLCGMKCVGIFCVILQYKYLRTMLCMLLLLCHDLVVDNAWNGQYNGTKLYLPTTT